MKNIETKRLILRNFNENDYDDVYEFLSQRKNDRFEAYPDITYENGKEHLAYRINNDDFICLELKDTKKIIGNIYFAKRDFEAYEIGYIVNKNYQRKGYAKEAIEAIIASFSFHRIYAECHPENVCSYKLLESLGFKKEAHFRNNVSFKKDESGNPIWQDTLVYALLSDDIK